jgi:hypothetical protein
MGYATFKAGDLTAVIGDNAAEGSHRAGYNGVWSLKHRTCPRDLFVSQVAGMNYEHNFDGETDDARPEVFFEPRHAPMTFRRLSDREAELHQPPTPTFHLESWTRFTLAPPHSIDFQYRCKAHQHIFRRGYIGLFWASYISAPEDKSMYFLGGMDGQTNQWTQLCTQYHNDKSTVRFRDDKTELTFREQNRPALFRNLSPLRFDVPLFYGLFENHVWIVMFDRAEGIRLTHSPSGGGFDAERKTTHPAWDFQYILPKYEVMQEYSFRARAVFRPRCSREEILKEYEKWKGSL